MGRQDRADAAAVQAPAPGPQAVHSRTKDTKSPSSSGKLHGSFSRLAVYMILGGWLIFGAYILALFQTADIPDARAFLDHFLFPEHKGLRFQALVLFAPLLATLIGVLLNEKEKLLRKTLSSEGRLHRMNEQVESYNRSLQREIEGRKKTEDELLRRERKYSTLFHQSKDGIILHDEKGTVLDSNQKVLDLFGYTKYEMLSLTVGALLPGGARKDSRDALGSLAEDGKANHVIDLRKKSGETFPAEVSSSLIQLGSANVVQSLVRDISERRKAEEEAVASRTRLRHLLTYTPAVIYSAEPRQNFTPTYISDNVMKFLGYDPQEFLEDPLFWKERVHPDDGRLVTEEMSRIFVDDHHNHEYRFRKSDGTYRWIYDEMRLLRNEEGEPEEIVGYWIDISERKKLEEQLQHDALHDILTDLPNRIRLLDRLEVSLARSIRNKDHVFAVLFLDLDRFKNVNDSFGHSVGDEFLISVARRLEACVRPGDTVARLSGDEFAILLDEIRDVPDAQAVAERIQHKLAEPSTVKGKEIFTSASIGIAMSNAHYAKPEEMMRDADIAMYQAKAHGKACYVLFDQYMHTQTMKRLELEHDLRRAMEGDEFHMLYQPIVSLKNNRIVGFEALLRWNHPERGLIMPDEFMAVAEETGLIVGIGQWSLQEACRQMRLWQERHIAEPPLSISVNISAKQFSQALVEDVRQVLQETGLDTRSLVLEMTESVIMDKSDTAAPLFVQLQDLNIRLHIDDFGTGYSSLSYLHHFPIDVLKIDKTFIKRLNVDEEKDEIVRAVINLAQNLNMDVIAEGVETREQLQALNAMKCSHAQGYLFSDALTEAKVEALLAKQPTYSFTG
jgi:diguanylate cyclase (GGDEF)-like protein/PAS domain S-box-containing protein